jgi:hypothetical protein
MTDVLLIIFVLIVIGFSVTVEVLIRKGKLRRVDTYSYSAVLKRGILHLIIAIAISLLVYLFSKSLDVTISIGVLLLFGVIGGCLYGFLWEYQTKRRGGRKVD